MFETTWLLLSVTPPINKCNVLGTLISLFWIGLSFGTLTARIMWTDVEKIALKAFAFRLSIVVATLIHELGHLLAAAVMSKHPLVTIFSTRNLLGNTKFCFWIQALVPVLPWPQTACVPHVILPFDFSSTARYVVSISAPVVSIFVAVVCTLVSSSGVVSEIGIPISVGTWMVALGGIASDILDVPGNPARFQCGNFGMLVVCAMDR